MASSSNAEIQQARLVEALNRGIRARDSSAVIDSWRGRSRERGGMPGGRFFGFNHDGIRSRDELGRRLRTIERIAAGCRVARAAEERRTFPQFTIGQFMVVVALWALGLAAWRLTW